MVFIYDNIVNMCYGFMVFSFFVHVTGEEWCVII